MGIGIDVMQPDPGPQRAEVAGKIRDMGAVPPLLGMAQVKAIGRGVLADHQQFAHAAGDQLLGLAHHRMGRAADKAAAQIGDDAELAGVIAALGNLQIGVVARRQPHLGRGQQVDERVRRGRHGQVHGVQHLLVLVGTRDGQHAGVDARDVFGFGAQAARHDHPAVFRKRLADGFEAFGLGAVQKAAGVHDHRVRALVLRADRITLGPQAGQDALAVHQRLGAAERDHADGRLAAAARGCARRRVVEAKGGGKIRAKAGRVQAHGPAYSDAQAERKARDAAFVAR